jgi:adenylate kinase
LSTGDLVRREADRMTARGDALRHVMVSGGLVPDEAVVELLREAMAGITPLSRGLVLDGFPRTVAQVRVLESAVLGRPVDLYIELAVNDEVLLQRLAARGRADDHERSVLLRLDEFERSTRPMIELLRAGGRLVTVDGAQPPAVVHRTITDELGRHLAWSGARRSRIPSEARDAESPVH